VNYFIGGAAPVADDGGVNRRHRNPARDAATMGAALVGGGALLLASLAHGADPRDPPESEKKRPRSESATVAPADDARLARVDAAPGKDAPVYRPPRRGAPRARVAGGLRAGRALPTPLALAPEHLAHTASADPSLFWHVDERPPAHVKVVFTLIHEDDIEPLVESQLPPPRRAGIQRIRLAQFGVQLDPEAEYEWSVALVPDPDQRSRDVISTGYLRRVAPPAELSGEQQGVTVSTYASLGLWYDALEAASDAIDAAPSDPGLRHQRDALLRQGGLEAAAE
jgi:hypothetical protein